MLNKHVLFVFTQKVIPSSLFDCNYTNHACNCCCKTVLQNEDRTLWKLGTLPPGLLSLFYKLTYPLNRGWHNFGLGHDPALNLTEIENAAVIHYNGNYKPRLDLAVLKYKYYWFRYLVYDNPYRGLGNTTE